MSPCTKRTPSRASRARFNSAPRRCRLSRTMIRASGNRCLRAIARVDPTKPAPPVISTHSYPVHVGFRLLLGVVSPVIIASGKVFLQPQVQYDEKISTPHLLNSKLGNTSLPIRPANGHYGKR